MNQSTFAKTDPQAHFEQAFAANLLQDQHITPAEIEEAQIHQFTAGGQLSTCLWELGILSPELVAQYHEKSSTLPTVSPKVVAQADPLIVKIIPAELAQQHYIIPFFMDRNELYIATINPWQLKVFDELRFKLAKKIKVFFLPEVPFMRLLTKLYGIPLKKRFGQTPTPRPRPNQTPTEPIIVEDLIGEADFQQIYAKQNHRPASREDDSLKSDLFLQGFDGATEPALQTSTNTPATTLLPLTDLATALSALENAQNRDELGDVFLRFILSKSKRVLLFTYHDSIWYGWLSGGLAEDKANSLMLPTIAGSIFELVATTGSPYIGPLSENRLHDRFAAYLGGLKPKSICFLPIHYGNKLILGAYFDDGPNVHTSNNIAEILILAQKIPTTLERLIKTKLTDK